MNTAPNDNNQQPAEKILCVEDSPTQAAQIKHILASEGYRVEVAVNGYESLSMAREINPDLVVLDIMLPDIDGYSVCRKLRSQSTSYMPIMMLSARQEVEDRLDGLDVGADDYLPKPFDAREFIARVKSLLRIKRLNDDLSDRLSEAKESFNVWRQVAVTDHLTGLYNRYYLQKMLQEEISVASRYGTPLACIMLDIDHFRDFNNTHGHLVGDEVLRGLARILGKDSRDSDVIARYGGEEFVLLLPMTDLEAAASKASRLCAEVCATPLASEAGNLHVTISLGVASLPDEDISTPLKLIAKADRALYLAKEAGRNRVVILGAGDSEPREFPCQGEGGACARLK
ncbi:MAG: diguanylate cyclase [Desulfarculaceae bacterium]|nr:diguanylate cyclase [Desulfarculaceae bacterium]MCF8072819.1 diguanylate cyclase [Desulfarculaceae bacterium]MCF8100987.1 diguanylate cyclase [Desulfarculaceae bacterium]MCF8115626.1 diguanylate cyclase [Desulfarculaceae bacterium]